MNDSKKTRPTAEKIQEILAHHLRVDPSKIKPESLLREDLGLDSADTIELVFKVEEIFNIQVPDDDLEKFKTVKDLVAYLEDKVRAP
ncbi:MAG: acyl carrier protein [Candidatus Binatia bacterium]